MKILLLSRHDRLGSSSRLRFMQYLPFFASQHCHVEVAPFFSDNYLIQLYRGQISRREILKFYFKRISCLTKAKRYDFVWIEKEIFPFLPAIVEQGFNFLKIPYVVDYDDATFHQYDQHRLRLVRTVLGHKIDAVMKRSSLVIAGNDYLAQRAKSAGAKRVEIVPTVVDLERYTPCPPKKAGEQLIIGWIGIPKTSHYLAPLQHVFKNLQSRFNVRFVAVGATCESLKKQPVEAWPWTEDSEVKSIQKFDIGIMPLPDSPWERGKCGYKLIQYMACGLPVVASPVGVNTTIVKSGINGFLAENSEQWFKALSTLIEDNQIRKKMGIQARIVVKEWYSLQIQAPRLLNLFHTILQ